VDQIGNWVFIAFFYCPRAEMSLGCKQTFVSWEEEVSPWPIITFWHFLKSALHFISKKPSHKRAGGVAQGVGPEFKT
jgi:hypothetical protein